MNFPSIDIQGSILSADLLGKIRSEQSTFQQGKDFNPAFTNAKLKDEISLAWQDAKGQWTIFQNKLKRVGEGETASTETRSFWILPLLSNLGYDFQYLKSAEELNGKSFWINNRDNNIGGFPLYIAGYNESLDRRSENKTLRVSPHALVQEYLNYSEHLYGLVTNGKLLRLLRDASRLTRLSYLEFNLEKIMEEDLYSDFVILYRLLHVSRMPQLQDGGAVSIIEKYHLEGLEAGATIRSKLGDAVKQSILSLANGFVNHPDNVPFRQTISGNHFNTDEFYRQQLRIVYRLLFLFVIEERNLVYSESKDPDIRRFSQIYYNHFSLQRIRKLAKRLPPPEAARHYDLWMGLVNTFALFEDQQIGAKMGIMALQGDLFSYDAITASAYDLHQCRLSNEVLLRVIKALGYFENDKQLLIAVNYGGLDVEEFGSVYEGLLELKLKMEPVPGSELFSCSFDRSSERSSSGSHYTPEELVQPLIKHSLDYIIEDRLKVPATVIAIPSAREKQSVRKQQLLSIRVCDVACGSGHILLSAARKIALAVARVETGEEQPNPKATRSAMRDIIRHCIYGVDKNPLAVELCKVAFWLESYNPGEPLGFLDHHIKCGDSIVGLAHREELENGIADEAFKTLPGDDKEIAAASLRQNKQNRNDKSQTKIDFEAIFGNELNEALVEYKKFNELPERTPEDIAIKQKAYKKFESETQIMRLQQLADAQIAQFFIPKTNSFKDKLITDAEYRSELNRNVKALGGIQNHKFAYSTALAKERRFFHWFLEFPDIFQNGGFDCILGNPPYLGGSKMSTYYGFYLPNYLISNYINSTGVADFVTYFFKRDFQILKENGFFSLITTDKISQGATREASLEYLHQKGNIIHAVKSIKWPGEAAVDIAVVSFIKGNWFKERFLNGRIVVNINSLLEDDQSQNKLNSLLANKNKSNTGVKVYGEGFVLSSVKAKELLLDNANKTVIFPYITGDDIVYDCFIRPSRFVINYFNWPLSRYSNSDWEQLPSEQKEILIEKIASKRPIIYAPSWYKENVASDFPHPLDIVEKLVKPEREIITNNNAAKTFWWHFERSRKELYDAIKSNNKVLVLAQTAKYVAPVFIPNSCIHSVKVIVFASEAFSNYSFLQSSIYSEWAWKYGTKMGNTTLQYSTSACFDNFPFPQNLFSTQELRLEQIGERYHEHRKKLMPVMQLGLTKTYNAFHAKEIKPGINSLALQNLDKKAIEKQYGKEVWNLWNHLQKTRNPDVVGTSAGASACTIEEAIAGIIQLRELHVQMDNAVLEAYGWAAGMPTSTGSVDGPSTGPGIGAPIQLRHDFYEVDYLPENDRIRYTIHPDARKDILKRLLELNHQYYEEEIKRGLHKKADVERFYAQKGLSVPLNTVSSDEKPERKQIKKENISTQAIQRSLFDDLNITTMKEFGLRDGIYSIRDTAQIINQPYDKVRRWFLKLSEANYEGLSDSVKTDIDNRRISFHGLVELVVIGELLEAGVKPKKIFIAREALSTIVKKPYPFATSDIKEKLKVSGRDIVFDMDDGIITLDGSGQFNLEFIREFFADIVFESRIAIQLLPAKGLKRIQINPKAAGGRPAFVSQKDVQVETIIRFYKGPDSVEEIIEDFGISEEDIKAALAYQT